MQTTLAQTTCELYSLYVKLSKIQPNLGRKKTSISAIDYK